MFTLRRPDTGGLLGLLTLAIIALLAVVRGQPVGRLELAFFTSIAVLMTLAAFTRGFLRSPWYPLVGGALITVFALLQYQQTQNAWFLFGTVVGVGFGAYGVVDSLNDARTERE
ncbi:hypothetical protein C2R22_04420 [Salinigranum rubrum]|uniref:Uncharacterized protein n=1 Tax=Salinigranum rubrum TaxID=755307 RepID=A0A2I8VGE6_9EURY|nr:hypothetical protein [Salinigranum rubrum]AUV80996.1 hypothetical protein C2R22_04420 [Salinigranum rubrum]